MVENLVDVEIRNLREVQEYLDELPENMFDDAKKVFRSAVLGADKEVKLRFSSGKIKARTGTLRRSLRTSVSGNTLKALQASFYSAANVGGTPVKYAPMQEKGGTVKAKKAYKKVPGGPYLNIPTFSNQTAAGVMRKSARMLFDEGAYIQKSKAGNWGVFLGGKMMMVLKKEVEIPARLGMIDAATDQIPTMLSRLAALVGEE